MKLTIALLACLAASSPALAQNHGAGHHGSMGHHHGADGTGHDEVNMPGLRGENVTEGETADLSIMFRNFTSIDRTVTNLPNGIRSVTHSEDPEVMETLVRHVIDMIARVEAGDDPKVFIQSPTLDIFFDRYDALLTEVEVTDEGIVVTQTSEDPELVAALHTHAAEVSDMAERGMQAVHERMMQGG